MIVRPMIASVMLFTLATFAWATGAIADVELERIAASISSVTVDYGCGPTPVPHQAPPQCETVATMKVVYIGTGCKPEDFFIRVRQLPTVQLVTLFKLSAAVNCEIGPSGSLAPGFSHIVLQTPLIEQGKPIRLRNTLALMDQPRP